MFRILGLFFLISCAAADEGNEPYPLEYFALREVVSNVEISPDGERVAMLKILYRGGNPVLYVHDASDLDAKPLTIGAEHMEIRTYGWISDTNIVMVLRQKVRDKIDGQNEGVYDFKIALFNVESKQFDEFGVANPQIESILPDDPTKIIISTIPGTEDKLGLSSAFRPRVYYKLNLKSGAKELLLQGKYDLSQIEFDAGGDPWLGRGFDLSKQENVWYYREKGAKKWDEIFRLHEDSFEDFYVEGKDEAKPGNILVTHQNGHDKAGLWSFNTKTKQFEELVYRRNDVDVAGTRLHSNAWSYPDTVVAVEYRKDRPRFEYFDELEGATYAQLEELIPHAHHLTITSRSRDGNSMTIANQGPRDPGTYYMIREGRLTMVGSQQPLIESEKLASMRYITYPARDGRDIPAYVTIPNGQKPFPLVVLPHGGPFVQETVIYDEWAQMLANNGYMVIQPQYRGSKGYGLDHYLSAWQEKSQAGYAMQDDKDDGALYLIEKGYADPERVAMFGWSYGGYAALVAASRDPQLYQCVIAGASVTDMIKQVNTIANEGWFRGAVEIEQMAYRKGAINPIDEVEKVNVPILLVHGSVDQRVQPVQARIYYRELNRHGKDYEYVELDGADHFYDTLFFEHQIKLYESMIGFLDEDCGLKADDLGGATAAN
ncbi:MAG: prolyl oligopeptidase family serine peptidase [Woeseiaceae bacterium]|nr:prolyl oligopeptidase family serine peptidase [Woeseiaceae bacterium]